MKKNIARFPFLCGGMILLFLLGTSLVHLPVGAQPTSFSVDSNKELDDKVKFFFDDLLAGNATKAFDDLLRSSSVNEPLAGMKTKLKDVETQFGNFKKYEKISVKPVGEDLVFLRYLLKCDKHPIVWTFTFYRRPQETGATISTPNSWSLIGLRFDSNLDPLLL